MILKYVSTFNCYIHWTKGEYKKLEINDLKI